MTTNAAKKSFVVLINDFTDPDALSRRMAVRETHLAEATRRRHAGILVSGGAIFDSHESGKMVGSALVVNADSAEDVLELLRSDPYTVGRAWDIDSAKIFPYREANF
ncbi:hypothetical protein LPJ53_001915 [Coemansia erecta]|uniref:YCII-related domain-containing protein n=1 Tax=Coemansia erecta TaxID=147472 RepID=A0A9W8CUD1_9FUNG|nr:hypothetical protein LPJ53_001915 [Coemansia erecta]